MFAAVQAIASRRTYALAHLHIVLTGGAGGAITCKQWLFCFCHGLKCQLWRWIWPQSEEQTKYAQVRFCVNRAAESLRSMSALQATRCHVNEQVERGSGGLAFSLQCCSRLSASCKPALSVCKCFKWKLPLDTCGRVRAKMSVKWKWSPKTSDYNASG